MMMMMPKSSLLSVSLVMMMMLMMVVMPLMQVVGASTTSMSSAMSSSMTTAAVGDVRYLRVQMYRGHALWQCKSKRQSPYAVTLQTVTDAPPPPYTTVPCQFDSGSGQTLKADVQPFPDLNFTKLAQYIQTTTEVVASASVSLSASSSAMLLAPMLSALDVSGSGSNDFPGTTATTMATTTPTTTITVFYRSGTCFPSTGNEGGGNGKSSVQLVCRGDQFHYYQCSDALCRKRCQDVTSLVASGRYRCTPAPPIGATALAAGQGAAGSQGKTVNDHHHQGARQQVEHNPFGFHEVNN